MCMDLLTLCVWGGHAHSHAQQVHASCLGKPEEGVIPPITGVIHSCEPQCAYWKLNTDPLQE